jgi:hypothetical protein
MGRVVIAARAGVHADGLALVIRETGEDAIIQIDELFEQTFRRVELHVETSFGEVDLNDCGAVVEARTHISDCVFDQFVNKLLLRIPGDAILRIEQRHGGRRYHCLFRWPGRVLEGARQSTDMAIFEGDRYAVSGQVGQPVTRAGGKAGLGLFAVRDNGRASRFEAFYRVLHGTIEKPSSAADAADGFSWDRHCDFFLVVTWRIAANGRVNTR